MMFEIKSLKEVRDRVMELRGLRDKYIEEFSKNELNESSIKNYEHINTRLDELSRLIIYRGSASTMIKEEEK